MIGKKQGVTGQQILFVGLLLISVVFIFLAISLFSRFFDSFIEPEEVDVGSFSSFHRFVDALNVLEENDLKTNTAYVALERQYRIDWFFACEDIDDDECINEGKSLARTGQHDRPELCGTDKDCVCLCKAKQCFVCEEVSVNILNKENAKGLVESNDEERFSVESERLIAHASSNIGCEKYATVCLEKKEEGILIDAFDACHSTLYNWKNEGRIAC